MTEYDTPPPQELEEEMLEGEAAPEEMAEEERLRILDSLRMAIVARRKEAIEARFNSGIEQIWTEDEEAYQGIDDANRHEHGSIAAKPAHAENQLPVPRKNKYGSTAVPNITAPYTDAAAARIGDMLLPTDDRNFAIKPTPIPDLADVMAKLPPEAQQVGPEQIDAKLKATKAEADRKAEKAQTRIDDWLTECDFHGEMRTVIDDCARLGSGVVKGPHPVRRRAKAWRRMGPEMALEIIEKTAPASKRIDCWDLFPDKDCGADIHQGDYIFERDRLSATKLRELKGQAGYIDSQIDLVLKQDPMRHTPGGKFADKAADTKDLYEVWYYYGILKADEIRATGCECSDEDDTVYAIITMINDTIVRSSPNPLDGGDFPYDIIPWKKRRNMPWGVGVAREIRTPQRIVTAATRRLLDNAGFAGGPQIVVRKNGLRPKDGKWAIHPLKVWEADEDTDVNKAFAAVEFPMLIDKLERIIQIGMKFAEDVTGLPMLLQGQQGKAPDTVGGMTMLNNNATGVLRRIARLFDSKITEPHIRRYYDYLMEFGEDEDEKGDYKIDARGSSALVERDIQAQEAVQVLQLSINPAFGWNPKKAAAEYLKSRRFTPANFEYTPEELEQMAQQEQPTAPQIQAAQIRAQSAAQVAQINAEVKMATDATDTDRDLAYVQAETARSQSEHQARMAELGVRRELALLDYANKRGLNLDKVKAELAKTAMTLQTQERMANANNQARQVAKPAFEPKGRAPNGQAFQR